MTLKSGTVMLLGPAVYLHLINWRSHNQHCYQMFRWFRRLMREGFKTRPSRRCQCENLQVQCGKIFVHMVIQVQRVGSDLITPCRSSHGNTGERWENILKPPAKIHADVLTGKLPPLVSYTELHTAPKCARSVSKCWGSDSGSWLDVEQRWEQLSVTFKIWKYFKRLVCWSGTVCCWK